MITQTKSGLPLAVESWTLERYAEHWIRENVSARLRPSTISSDRETLRLHVLPVLDRTSLRSLTPAQIRELLATKTAAGLSPRSVRLIHGTLRSMLAEAMRDELVERNVASVVRAPSGPQHEVQPWSTEEAATFLKAVSQHRLHGLFAVGVALGLRKGELLALRWEDVDLDARTIRVRQTVQRLPGLGPVYGPPKSLRSRRTIPLPDASARALRRHRAQQAEEALATGPSWTDSGLVFTSTVGTMLEPRNLTSSSTD